MACPCTPEIKRDGQSINATTKKKYALVGQTINLSMEGCDGYTLTDITWDVPGRKFEEFTWEQAYYPSWGNATSLSSSDFSGQRSISFHWLDAADGRVIQVNFKANGQACSAQATLDVKRPTVTESTRGIGEVRCYHETNGTTRPMVGLICYAVSGSHVGIAYACKVEVPLDSAYGFQAGTWAFVNVVSRPISRFRGPPPSYSCTHFNLHDRDCLDTLFPYYGATYPTNENHYVFRDAPAIQLDSQGFIEHYRSDAHHTYVMFKPAGDGQWVPLRRQRWSCSWCVKLCPGGWKLLQKWQYLFTPDNPDWHPSWTGNTELGIFVTGTPPSCGSCGTTITGGCLRNAPSYPAP